MKMQKLAKNYTAHSNDRLNELKKTRQLTERDQ